MGKFIVANWKENPTTEKEALALFEKTAAVKRSGSVHVVVCPPLIHLPAIAKKFKALRSKKNFELGAQDIFWGDSGAFTGEVGPLMVRSLGVQYVIVGHSETRRFAHETDAAINKKLRAAWKEGLRVILCVGEPASVRRKGMLITKNFIKNQLIKDLKDLGSLSRRSRSRLMVAYEPIWAIGSGKSDTPADALAMAAFIKKTILSKFHFPLSAFLYGGSTNDKNIGEYLHYQEIGGVLVGGASLKPKEIGRMIQYSGNLKS